MEQSLLLLAKDWTAPLAGIVLAGLMGFRWWFSARREIREDHAADTTHSSYQDTIKMLREENERLWRIAEFRQEELIKAEQKFRDLCDECRKRGLEVPYSNK